MSQYHLLPSADIAGKETSYVWWENGFSDDELNAIDNKARSKNLEDAVVGLDQGYIDNNIRRSKVAWLRYDDIPWLYDRLGWIARQLNGQFFHCDLTGFNEDLQYTTYQSEDQGHYDWHMDRGFDSNGAPPRKLSMVLLLNNPEDYEGGDLQILTGSQPTTLQKTRGMVHVFPSYVLHRVTPVTKGIRNSLVVWLCGPKWK